VDLGRFDSGRDLADTFGVVPVRSAIVAIIALVLTLVGTSCGSEEDSNEKAASEVKPVGPCRIAFRVRVADYGDVPSDIHVINPDGTGQRNLTPGEARPRGRRPGPPMAARSPSPRRGRTTWAADRYTS
jgi:hypothetical protein